VAEGHRLGELITGLARYRQGLLAACHGGRVVPSQVLNHAEVV
jgi:hypothetical protein